MSNPILYVHLTGMDSKTQIELQKYLDKNDISSVIANDEL